ncbi:MAG: ABC transporter ATP-binding protein [Tagaea sp.]|nr:ABC transporter ATP-binding protein [Tagaea sp.]
MIPVSGGAPILSIRNLEIELRGKGGRRARVVSGIHLDLHAQRTLALVGESGCGKSVTAFAAMNLLTPPLRATGGSIVLRGPDGDVEITGLDPLGARMRALRGRHLAMVFQDPMSALDPVYPVGEQIAETIRAHLGLSHKAAWARAVTMLHEVRIPDPERRAHEFPFQLSGGMRQRVMIAMALACAPRVLIADEPTTALDVTVQAQILAQLRDLGSRFGLATLIVTHDLGVVAENAHDVIVMYRGEIAEAAPVEALFAAPAHPYTQGLLRALPAMTGKRRSLVAIPGGVPDLFAPVAGCTFADRCAQAMPVCRRQRPASVEIAPGHRVACFLHAPEKGAVA